MCCCFTTESSCSTSILTPGYLDGLIKNRSQDATAGKLYVSYAVHDEGIKDDTFIKTTIPHTEFQHFKSIEEILTSKNAKE
jgi:hypothetical protein